MAENGTLTLRQAIAHAERYLLGEPTPEEREGRPHGERMAVVVKARGGYFPILGQWSMLAYLVNAVWMHPCNDADVQSVSRLNVAWACTSSAYRALRGLADRPVSGSHWRLRVLGSDDAGLAVVVQETRGIGQGKVLVAVAQAADAHLFPDAPTVEYPLEAFGPHPPKGVYFVPEEE